MQTRTCIRSSPVRPRWVDGRTESSRCKRTMRTPFVYIIFAVLAYINRTYAYQRDRRTDTTHRQTDLKTSVRSGPALVGGRTDKQCTQVLSKLCFCCLQTNIAHKNCTHVFFSHKFIRSNPAQMGGWIDRILNSKICSRPTLELSKQAASKPLTVHTEQLVVLCLLTGQAAMYHRLADASRMPHVLRARVHDHIVRIQYLSSVKECQTLSRGTSFAKLSPRKKICIVSAVAANFVPRGRDAAMVSMILALRLPTVVGYPYLSQM